MEQFMKINTAVNGFVWGPVMLALLVGTGIYLSIAVGFIQFTKIGYWWKNTIGKIFKKGEAGDGEITPLQAVSTALASTVGTGNIAGVTGAIILGGPGAVFWMWLSALFGMVTKFSEVTLAVKYRERNEKGDWCGGPMYYIKNGLGPKWKWLGGVFAVLGAIAAFGIGNIAQVHSIADSVKSVAIAFNENAASKEKLICLISGICVAAFVALVLIGGVAGINVFVVLLTGIFSGAVIMLATGAPHPTELLGNMGSGASGMFETIMVTILVSAMCGLIREYGGFEALLGFIRRIFHGNKGGQLGIGLLVGAMDIATANNTVAIVMAGPIAKQMSEEYGISGKKSASLLDTFSCIFQGIIPYGAQMLLAISACAELGETLTAFEIIPCLFYPYLLLISSLGFMILIPEKK